MEKFQFDKTLSSAEKHSKDIIWIGTTKTTAASSATLEAFFTKPYQGFQYSSYKWWLTGHMFPSFLDHSKLQRRRRSLWILLQQQHHPDFYLNIGLGLGQKLWSLTRVIFECQLPICLFDISVRSITSHVQNFIKISTHDLWKFLRKYQSSITFHIYHQTKNFFFQEINLAQI